MTPEQTAILERTRAAALDYGYTVQSDGTLRAPPGKFEGEPFYVLHYFQAVLDGDGEAFGDEERTDCDVFDLSEDERAAFSLDAVYTHVLLRHYESGFEGLEYLTPKSYAACKAAYSTDSGK